MLKFKSFYKGQVVTKEFYPQVLSSDSIFCILFFGSINIFFYGKVLHNGFNAEPINNLRVVFLLIICICFSIFLVLRFSPRLNMFFVREEGLEITYCGFRKLYKWENIIEFYYGSLGRTSSSCFFDYYDSHNAIKADHFCFQSYNGLNPLQQAGFLNRKLQEYTSIEETRKLSINVKLIRPLDLRE